MAKRKAWQISKFELKSQNRHRNMRQWIGVTMETYCCGYCLGKYTSTTRKCPSSGCGKTMNQVLQK